MTVRPTIRGLEGRKLNRTLERCTGNICECLSAAIDAMLNNVTTHGSGEKGLYQHVAEQTARGAQPPGSASWNVHETNIVNQQRNLRDHIREHRSRGCGDPPEGGSPVPAGAWEAANAPPPSAADWGLNNPAEYRGLTGSAVGDAAVGVGAGYLLYRAIRMLPSLFPPAWPSIPANLAIP
jgi:hypothetical protein